MTDGQYKFSISLDDSQFELDAKKAAKLFDELVKKAKEAGVQIDSSLQNPFKEINVPASLPQQTNEVAKSFNGLNVATQQIVRELPAATIGLNTFFLAVSNNLPILADQIKQVNEENKRLAEEGKPTVSVLKEIGKSLISWQTLLTVGITLLTMYGKDIVNWVGSLFKGKKGIDALKEAQEGLNNAIKENGLGIGDEIVKYKELSEAYKKLGEDMDARKKFITDNKDAFHDLGVEVQNVADANKVLVEGTPAVIAALKAQAQANVARKLAEDAVGEQATAEVNAENIRKGGANFWDALRSMMSYNPFTGNMVDAEFFNEKRAKKEEEKAKEQAKLADAYWKYAEDKAKEANDILKNAGITPASGDNEAELRAEEQRLKQLTDARIRLRNDARRATTEAELAAMQEGLAKKLAQIDYEYDEEERKIAEREQQLKALNGGRLSDSDAANIAAMRSANAQSRNTAKNAAWDAELAWGADVDKEMADATEALKAELNKRNKAWEDYLIEFGTFKERFKATQDKYNRLIAEAETEGERKALMAERDAALAVFEVQAQGYAQEIANKSIEELNRLAEELQAQVDAKQAAFDALDSSNSAEAQDYLKTINELKAKIAELKKRIGEASDEVASDNWSGAALVFQNISSTATEAASALSEMNPALGKIYSGLANIAEIGGDAVSALKALSTAASAVETASAVLMVISVVIKTISTITTGLTKIISEHKEAMFALTQVAQQYKLALEGIAFQEEMMSYSSIFGDDKFGEFNALIEKANEYKEALEDVREEANKRVDYGFFVSQSEKEDLDVRAKVEVWDNSKLIADMRSGWQKMWGSSKNIEVTELDEFYENGVLNIDKLKAYYDNYKDYLSKEQQLLLEQLIATGEQFEDASQAATDYLKDIFGDLGASITDSLVDAFRNGTDAVKAMGDAVGNIVEQIATDMAHAAFIQPLLEQAQDAIEALNKKRSEGGLSDEEYMRELIHITNALMGNAQDAGEDMADYLDMMRQMAKEMGIDIFESDSVGRSAQSKGIAQASQDSVDELNGRMTTIQSHTFSLVEGQRQLVNDSAQALRHLANIERNTDELHQMRSDLSNMKKDINTMVTRGIATY